MENKFKKVAVFFGLLFFADVLLIKLNIINHDVKGYMLVFDAIIFVMFISFSLLFFIKSDIAKDQFYYLKRLNYLATIIGMITFIYWTFIKPVALNLLFPSYTVIFVFCNIMLMSVIYSIKRIGNKYIIDQWLLLAFSIFIYLAVPIILLNLNIIEKR